MALADLLRAIETEADAERARAGRRGGGRGGSGGRVTPAARPTRSRRSWPMRARPRAARAAAHERALARLDAAAAIRSAREEAFVSLLSGIRAELADRARRRAPTRSCSTRSWPRAGPPCQQPVSCASTRATRTSPTVLPTASASSRRSTPGAASSWRAMTAGRSGTRSRSASPTPSLLLRERLAAEAHMSDFVYGNTRLHARRAALLRRRGLRAAARRGHRWPARRARANPVRA